MVSGIRSGGGGGGGEKEERRELEGELEGWSGVRRLVLGTEGVRS